MVLVETCLFIIQSMPDNSENFKIEIFENISKYFAVIVTRLSVYDVATFQPRIWFVFEGNIFLTLLIL